MPVNKGSYTRIKCEILQFPPGVAGQICYSHLSAWCVGGLVPFMINTTHLRTKPLTLASGHGRYITVTPERTLLFVGEWPLHIAVINL